jgi:pimeloyl-ACP methyl ester carboxylesterase
MAGTVDDTTDAPKRLGRFRSPAQQESFLRAYDQVLALWPEPPMHHVVATQFGSTHLLVSGSTTGAPIVLLHAVAVSSPSWGPAVASLGAHHPVIAIDTVGDAGRSEQTAPLTDAAALAQWLDEVFEAYGLERVHLVGLSYGAWIGLNQARRSASRLASLVAVDPPTALGRPQLSFIIKLVPDSLAAKVTKSDKAVHRLLGRLNNGAPPAPPLLDLCVTGLRSYRRHQPFPQRFTDRDLQAITTPTMLMLGENSPVNHARRAADRARTCMPAVRSEIIPNAGHMIPIESADLFSSLALRFIDDIDSHAPRIG